MFFDTHADIWTDITHKRNLGINGSLRNFHFPRMKQSGMEGGIFVIWVDPPYDAHPQNRTLEMANYMTDEMLESQDIAVLARSFDEYMQAKDQGKLAIIAGIEGLSGLGDDLEYLYPLYAMGVRHASLTWNEENPLATGVGGNPARGLTSLGITVVSIMEQLKMIIDVSHANEKTFWDIMEHSTGTVIASHSNCASLCDALRNLTDDQIRAIAERDGIIGVNSYGPFVHRNPALRDMEHFIDHIEHIIEIVGLDYVGFGFDFTDFLSDGTLSHFAEDSYSIPELENVTKVPLLLTHMKKRGFTKDEIDQICKKNMYRVMKNILT